MLIKKHEILQYCLNFVYEKFKLNLNYFCLLKKRVIKHCQVRLLIRARWACVTLKADVGVTVWNLVLFAFSRKLVSGVPEAKLFLY